MGRTIQIYSGARSYYESGLWFEVAEQISPDRSENTIAGCNLLKTMIASKYVQIPRGSLNMTLHFMRHLSSPRIRHMALTF